MMTAAALSQADFARHIGVGRSYVTALKKSGRLVLDDVGKVLVAPSMEAIAKSNGAPERAAVVVPTYSDAKIRKEEAEAGLKEIELAKQQEILMVADDIRKCLSEYATTLRTRLERLPDRLAPQLAATCDEQQVRAMLTDAVEMALTEMSRHFESIAKT